MKVNKLVLAVSIALSAPSAFAATAIDLTQQSIPTANIFYVSGASATTPALASVLTSFCSTGNMTTYADSSGKNGFAYYCSSALANTVAGSKSTGFTLGAKFLVVKMDEGGSFNGVAPVASTSNLNDLTGKGGVVMPKFVDIADCGKADVAIASSVLAGSNGGTCATSASQRRPHFGLSDVPNAIWSARGMLTSTDAGNLTQTTGFAGQGFGIVVSPSLYAALQADQFGLPGVAYAGSERPSISRAQYAAIASQTTGVWDILLPKAAAAFKANTSIPGAITFPPSSALRLARRTATSGTQASSDMYFLNNPCSSKATGVIGSATPTAAGSYVDSTNYSSSVTLTVTEETSTGNVKTAVQNAASYALGVVSLENAETGLTTGAKFVKLDGIDPIADAKQRSTVVNGQYGFAYELEIIRAKNATNFVTGGPTWAQVNTWVGKLVAALGNASVITASTGIYVDPNNTGGSLVEGVTNHYSRNNNACATQSWIW